ncbi:hypothetical protein [Sphingomonas sp. NFR04]|uniref:hypothetical protein n=1 Tax=Sphingomonas sp. NFR04 TaxID=1566283 RepID=UPI000B87844A|nr:hypothetical protein [Sphingomonas sp. NFR04]
MSGADTPLRPEPPLIARIAADGAEEWPASDTLLFGRGDRGPDFFVVLEGVIDRARRFRRRQRRGGGLRHPPPSCGLSNPIYLAPPW